MPLVDQRVLKIGGLKVLMIIVGFLSAITAILGYTVLMTGDEANRVAGGL